MIYPGRHEYGPVLSCIKNASLFRRAVGAFAAFALTVPGSAVIMGHIVNRPETPRVFHYFDDDDSPVIDDQLNVVEWNMHNQTEGNIAELSNISRTENADAIMLVETSQKGSQLLAKSLGGYVTHLNTDRVIGYGKGFGIAIWTSQEPKSVEAETIEGNSVWSAGYGTVKGLVEDITTSDTSFTKTKEGRQENRGALAVTIKVLQDGELQDARLIVSHISAKAGIHDRQTDELVDYLGENIKRNNLTFFCGDTNSKWAEISEKLSRVGFFVPQVQGFSSANSNKTIDHCALPMPEGTNTVAGSSVESGISGLESDQPFRLVRAGVLKYKTDHRPVSVGIAMRPKIFSPQNLSDTQKFQPRS